MRRFLHRNFARGQRAQKAAVLLMLVLLAVLAVSLFHGVRAILS